MIVVCGDCGLSFGSETDGGSYEFDIHDCEAIPGPPRVGESWDAYEERCDEYRKEFLRKRENSLDT